MSEQLVSKESASKDFLLCAVHLAEGIRSADARSDAAEAIVPMLLTRGDVDLAAALADSVADQLVRDRLLTETAVTCISAGDDEYAIQLAEEVTDSSLRSHAFERIACAKIKKGEIEDGLSLMSRTEFPDEVIIAAYVEKTMTGVSDDELLADLFLPYSRCLALQQSASCAFRDGKAAEAVAFLERAVVSAQDIDVPEERVRALTDIAHNLVDVGRRDLAISALDAALKSSESVETYHRPQLLSGVAIGFFKAGSTELADQVLDQVTDKTAIVTALLGFVGEHRVKAENEDAVATLEEAFQVIKGQAEKETRDTRAKFNQWRSVSVQLAELGLAARAIEIAKEMPDADMRSDIFSQLALRFVVQPNSEANEAEALSGVLDQSKKVFTLLSMSDEARKISNDKSRALLERAVAEAESLEQLLARVGFSRELCSRQFSNDMEADARATAARCCSLIKDIRDEGMRAVALGELAAVYERLGKSPTSIEQQEMTALLSAGSQA